MRYVFAAAELRCIMHAAQLLFCCCNVNSHEVVAAGCAVAVTAAREPGDQTHQPVSKIVQQSAERHSAKESLQDSAAETAWVSTACLASAQPMCHGSHTASAKDSCRVAVYVFETPCQHSKRLTVYKQA
jgi:hypothetical protein